MRVGDGSLSSCKIRLRAVGSRPSSHLGVEDCAPARHSRSTRRNACTLVLSERTINLHFLRCRALSQPFLGGIHDGAANGLFPRWSGSVANVVDPTADGRHGPTIAVAMIAPPSRPDQDARILRPAPRQRNIGGQDRFQGRVRPQPLPQRNDLSPHRRPLSAPTARVADDMVWRVRFTEPCRGFMMAEADPASP